MHAKMRGNPIDGTKSAWQQHPNDLARPLRRLVAEVGQLHVQRSLHLAIQHRICSRDWHIQVAAAANDSIAFLGKIESCSQHAAMHLKAGGALVGETDTYRREGIAN